jgi:hypothetical protein
VEIPPFPPEEPPDVPAAEIGTRLNRVLEELDALRKINDGLRLDLEHAKAENAAMFKRIEGARKHLQTPNGVRIDESARLTAEALAACQTDLVAAHGALPADCGEGSLGERISRVVAQRDEARRYARVIDVKPEDVKALAAQIVEILQPPMVYMIKALDEEAAERARAAMSFMRTNEHPPLEFESTPRYFDSFTYTKEQLSFDLERQLAGDAPTGFCSCDPDVRKPDTLSGRCLACRLYFR